MYRIRVRRTRRPAPVLFVLLGLLLVSGVWLTLRPEASSKPKPTHHRVVKSTAVRFTPGIPAVPKPIPSALPFAIGESSGILWNLTDHQLMWALKPNQVGAYASTTKLMTFYLAYHRLALNRVIHVTPFDASITGSDIDMTAGDTFTVKQLFYGLLMASANDAAVTLATTISGTEGKFVQLMNQTASQLGMTHTHYGDADGLSPASNGSAWDLSIIAMQDLQIPLFRKIVDTKYVTLPDNPPISNLNQLLFMDPSVIGVKTGWTTQAGFNVVFEARRDVGGRPVTLLGILMHGQYGFGPVDTDAESLLNWGYAQLSSPKK